jgi:transglutaminase-like putative cysteine protease
METGEYLKPTPIIDCDAPSIQEKQKELTGEGKSFIEKAQSLFYFVRDEIRYNPYLPRYLPEHFRASETLSRRKGFCIQKAVLLIALSRSAGIPARPGFAVLRNHILPPKMATLLEGDILPDHGYAELWLNDKWVKATPAFDMDMCRKNGIVPVEFDGMTDATFHSHTKDGKLHIEYLLDRGHYDEVPIDEIRQWDAAVLKPEMKRKILGM